MRKPVAAIFLLVLTSCSDLLGDGAYTLYRNSVLDGAMRIHIATFDSKDGSEYNRQNCDIAAALFREQPGVTVNYWCEPGRAR